MADCIIQTFKNGLYRSIKSVNWTKASDKKLKNLLYISWWHCFLEKSKCYQKYHATDQKGGINFGGSKKKLNLAGTNFGGFLMNPPKFLPLR